MHNHLIQIIIFSELGIFIYSYSLSLSSYTVIIMNFDFVIFSVSIYNGDVFDLRELDTTNNGEGEVPVEDRHEAGDAEEEQDGGGANSGGGDL